MPRDRVLSRSEGHQQIQSLSGSGSGRQRRGSAIGDGPPAIDGDQAAESAGREMPSFFILCRRVAGFMPSLTAAPCLPSTTQSV